MNLVSFGSAFSSPAFWLAVIQIIWINILLSGDNAVVIALACRDLPARRRVWGMAIGAGVAAVLRIVFTGMIASLMQLPYLKIAGGLALFYIAARLLVRQTWKGRVAWILAACLAETAIAWLLGQP